MSNHISIYVHATRTMQEHTTRSAIATVAYGMSGRDYALGAPVKSLRAYRRDARHMVRAARRGAVILPGITITAR